MTKKITIIGLGHVGLPMMTILSNLKKNNKYLYDVDVIEKKNKEDLSITKEIKKDKYIFRTNDKKFSKLLKKSFQKKIKIRNDFINIKNSDIIIVSINFEISNDIKKYKPLKDLVVNIAKNIKKNALILFETTVPPGTSEKVLIPEIIKILKKRKLKISDINYAFSFERVMPGKNYLNSITSNFRCYSGFNESSKIKCKKFLSSFINTKKFPLTQLNTITECETAKILENSYRAINIAFIDEWTKYADRLKINLFDVINSIKKRPTHSNIMNPGLGVGGYCLTKDPLFAISSSKIFFKKKSSFPIIKKSISINKQMPNYALEYIKSICRITNKSKILILGVTYKEDVGDIRHSPSISLMKKLLRYSRNIKYIDPFFSKKIYNCTSLKLQDNLKNFDLILLCTAHKQFKKLEANFFSKKTFIFDLNNVLKEIQFQKFERKLKIFKLGNYAN